MGAEGSNMTILPTQESGRLRHLSQNRTEHSVRAGDSRRSELLSDSVDLLVTSPPYPMIGQWDEVFAMQSIKIHQALKSNDGDAAFELMHKQLDPVWREANRVLRPGGLACIVVGDATRSLNGDFRLYPNHVRILQTLINLDFTILPDILWRKPTNAPSKFMGSGMLPAGAYVTYEHEYILLVRKGGRREFGTAEEKARRRESAYFWEERNVWFSDVWMDIPGAQQLHNGHRSGAFPFELAYRLVCMFSVKGDWVLDPFAGTGTTTTACMAAGRNSIAIEIDDAMVDEMRAVKSSIVSTLNDRIHNRLARHRDFVDEHIAAGRTLKYENLHHGFQVKTAQERDLILNLLQSVQTENDTINVTYDEVASNERSGGPSKRRSCDFHGKSTRSSQTS